MGIQQSINNISRLGHCLVVDVDHEGLIMAGVYTKPHQPSGISVSVLEPANEIGHDLGDVLEQLVKRLNNQMAMENKS